MSAQQFNVFDLESVRAAQEAMKNSATVAVPEWETPAHEEINLATVNPEDLGLDPYDSDNSLVKAIYRAQADPYPNVPEELKRLPQWVTWSGDITKKQPFRSGTLIAAETDNPAHLASYQDATDNIRYGKGYPQLGFLPTDSIFGVDIDSCRDPQTGNIFPWAVGLFEILPKTYSEVTPSQAGARAWLIIHGLERKKITYKIDSLGSVPGKNPQVEILAKNYGTITGQQIGDTSKLAEMTLEQWSKVDEYLRSLAPKNVPGTKTGTLLDTAESVNAEIDGPAIPHGSHDNTLYRIGCSLRARGWEYPEIKERLVQVCQARCEGHGEDFLDMCEKKARSAMKHKPNPPSGHVILGGVELGGVSAKPEASAEHRLEFSEDTDIIPEFDSSVVNGIYAKFVELMTRGTTLVPQYAFLVAKTYIGLRLAGKVKFATVDAQPRYFGVAIGETGSGKGAAFARLRQMMHALGLVTGSSVGVKILDGVDSGAGLKDFFFESPEKDGVLLYVDEAATYANKTAATRNPSALDDVLELVDQTSVSRTLSAGRGKQKSKRKDDAYLAMYMCAQDGDVLQRLFSGRGKLGALDRLTPEYSVPVKPGRMPEISPSDAMKVLVEVTAMIESTKGKTIGIQPEAEALLETFWDAQVPATQTKVRWRKYILVDAYMSAFGEGRDTATVGDMQIAIRLFERQLALRKAFFKNMDVGDKVGYYLAKCKVITEWMQVQQAVGKAEWIYAQSKRDYETKTHAYRAHEEAYFDKAWALHSKGRLSEIRVKKSNGREYTKYVPQPEEPEE